MRQVKRSLEVRMQPRRLRIEYTPYRGVGRSAIALGPLDNVEWCTGNPLNVKVARTELAPYVEEVGLLGDPAFTVDGEAHPRLTTPLASTQVGARSPRHLTSAFDH